MTSSPIFVHALALNESSDVGEGSKIWAYAHIMKNAKVGTLCNIGEGVFVESGAIIGSKVTVKNQVLIWSGVEIEDECFIGPNVLFTNDKYPRSPRMQHVGIETRYSKIENWLERTLVKQGASIGAGTVIAPGLTIGEYAMIGCGAVVTKDVPAYALVMGNPAKIVGRVDKEGRRV